VAGIGTDPQTRVGKSRFEHQVGFEAADILVTHGEQYRNSHIRKLVAQIMQ
jgi:cytochrome c-type biogenesis protein CcmE